MAKLLRDPIPQSYVAETQLVEATTKEPGILGRVKAVFSAYDIENKNGRLYQRPLWTRQLEMDEIKEKVKNMQLLGEADHPETRMESVIKEASHTITEMYDDGNGLIRGEIALLDVPLGRIVHKMLLAGVKLGLSTRGNGDLIEDDEGGPSRVDPDTYEFHGVDFVLNPSFSMAGPVPIGEDTKKEIRTALIESVEAGNLHKDTAKDVEALLEGTKEPRIEGEDEIEIVNVKALETVLEELKQAHFTVSDLQEAKEKADNEKSECLIKIATLTSKAIVKVAVPTEDTTTKDTLVSMQEKHLDVVEKYKKVLKGFKALKNVGYALKSEKEALEAKLIKATKIIEEMKNRLLTAIAKGKKSKKDAEVRMKIESLRTYRKAKTDGVEVSGSYKKLLESAKTEEEIDLVMNDLNEDLARRYPDLPFLLHSRGEREELMRTVLEKCGEKQVKKEPIDPDFERMLDGTFGKEIGKEDEHE